MIELTSLPPSSRCLTFFLNKMLSTSQQVVVHKPLQRVAVNYTTSTFDPFSKQQFRERYPKFHRNGIITNNFFYSIKGGIERHNEKLSAIPPKEGLIWITRAGAAPFWGRITDPFLGQPKCQLQSWDSQKMCHQQRSINNMQSTAH